MSLPFKPIQDLVVVAKDATERLLASGLVIPHVDDDPDRQLADDRDVATVLAVGAGKLLHSKWGGAISRRPMTVAEGDRIVFGRNKGQSIRFADVDYLVLREEHIIGRLNDYGFEPLGGYIVAEQVKAEKVTEHGVIVPEIADDREEATVLSVGPGEITDDGKREPIDLIPGDTILFNPRMAEPFMFEGRELLAMRQDHIMCVSNRSLSDRG
jgi:chaperonin GroES